MKSKFVRVLLAIAVTLTLSALAQTGSAATPSSPGATSANPPAETPANPPAASAPSIAMTGTKVGAINIEGAIFGSNEGRKEVEVLQKKFEPKQNELKSQNDELESLKKQLDTQGPKLNEDAAANLKKQIESKQKLFDRAVQDAQEEYGSQQQDIASKVLQKMAPIIMKYAQENGFGMIVDTSKPWPQSPILVAGQGVDITKQVVDLYNAQSGVPAPTASGTSKPTAPRSPASTTPKATTPKASEAPKK